MMIITIMINYRTGLIIIIAIELLEEEEMDITDINNLIYAAAKFITKKLNEKKKKK
jgi:hypothetical protein